MPHLASGYYFEHSRCRLLDFKKSCEPNISDNLSLNYQRLILSISSSLFFAAIIILVVFPLSSSKMEIRKKRIYL